MDRIPTAQRGYEEKFRTLVEQSLIGVYILEDHRISYANPRLAEIFGYPIEELIGSDPLRFIHPEDHPMVTAKIEQRISGQVTDDRYELRIVRRDGAFRNVELHASRIQVGEKTSVVGTLLDVTEQKKADEWKNHLAAIVETSNDAIIAYDLNGRVLSWNPAAERLFGISAAEMQGESIERIFPTDRKYELPSILELIRMGERLEHYETRRYRNGGELIDVSLTISPIWNSKREVIAASSIARDITRQKAAEKQLEKAERLSSLGRVAATIAHEFNNVLMGIQPHADLLDRLASDDRMRKATERIRASVRRGKSVAEEILRAGQPREPALQRVPVAEWLGDEIVPELHSMLGKNIQIAVTVDDPNLGVLIDPDQMAQVLMNLATNARDAMNGSGTMTVRASRCEPGQSFSFGIVPVSERFVQISVSDTGPGIDEATLPHIFEPMFTTKRNGNGLGLAVVHQIVHRHAGKVFVQSVLGNGTTFHLFLPFAGEAAESQSRVSTVVRTQSARPWRVLIVDDDLIVATGISEILALEGLEAEAVHTGGEALGAIARFRPDVLLLDVSLPDGDGFERYADIAAQYPSLPVIFSTGSTPKPQPPGTQILLKPYAIDLLLTTIEKALNTPAKHVAA